MAKTYKEFLAEIKEIPPHLWQYMDRRSVGFGGPKAKELYRKHGEGALEDAKRRYEDAKRKRPKNDYDFGRGGLSENIDDLETIHKRNAKKLDKILSAKGFKLDMSGYGGGRRHSLWIHKNHLFGSPKIVYETRPDNHRISLMTQSSDDWIDHESKTFKGALRKFKSSQLKESVWRHVGTAADLGMAMLAPPGGIMFYQAGEKRDVRNAVNKHKEYMRRYSKNPNVRDKMIKNLEYIKKLAPLEHAKIKKTAQYKNLFLS